MKRILSLTLCLVLMGLVASSVLARESNERLNFARLEAPAPASFNGVRQDTFWLFADPNDPDYDGGAWGDPGTDARGYTFDDGQGGPTTAGWTSVDDTAQPGQYWHVDDAQLNVGHGTEPVITIPQNDAGPNNYAVWCGRQNVCGWLNPTGYGGNWNQYWKADIGPGPYTINYDYWYLGDFEGVTYDFFEFGTFDSNGDFVDFFSNTATAEQTLINYTGSEPDCYGSILWRFISDGGWSDEDGSYISDIGAVWIDQITLTGGATEYVNIDFESGSAPAGMGPYTEDGAGLYAELYANLYQEDICIINSTYAWAWTDCISNPPDPPEYPVCGTPAEPCPDAGGVIWMDNLIESPKLSLKHALGDGNGQTFVLGPEDGVHFEWWMYYDNPLEALILSHWYVRAYTVGGDCPGRWTNDNYVYYGSGGVWIQALANSAIGPAGQVQSYIIESAQGLPVEGVGGKVGVIDAAAFWCGTNGDGENQTSAPYLDNVRMAITSQSAINWGVDDLIANAQDNFPGVGGTVRFDGPDDSNADINGPIVVTDSLVVEIQTPLALGADATNPSGETRPQLYMFWRVAAGPHEGSTDAAMGDPDASDGTWSPKMPGTVTYNGMAYNWCVADSASSGGPPANGRFCFDLSDNYFLPGDIIHYFFRATLNNNYTEFFPEYATAADPLLRSYYVMDCLPTDGMDLLFVDDALTISFWMNEGFAYNGITMYDTYDVLAPSSGLGNGLSGRATNADIAQYSFMVWDSGALESYTLTNGDFDNNDKSDDTTLLGNWLRFTGHETYLWLLGNEIAQDLTNAEGFVGLEMGANLLTTDFYGDCTGIIVPSVTTTLECLAYDTNVPGKYWLDGGCPSIENYDLVAPQGTYASAAATWDVPCSTYPSAVAGILQLNPDDNNDPNDPNAVLYMPYTYAQLRDKPGPWTINGESYVRLLVGRVLTNCFGLLPDDEPNDAPDVPAFTKLEGNYPNPFNPKTVIRFSLSADDFVNLSVYDISGRLVTELVNGPMIAGAHEIVWDGKDADGAKSASGVYFYKLNAGDYSATEKMVMLK